MALRSDWSLSGMSAITFSFHSCDLLDHEDLWTRKKEQHRVNAMDTTIR